LKLRACYSEGVWYNEAQVKQLSTIGTKEENLSKLAGALYNAVAQSAQVLQAPIRDFAYVIKALEDKQK
jgi:large subunit ribosomal protein L10